MDTKVMSTNTTKSTTANNNGSVSSLDDGFLSRVKTTARSTIDDVRDFGSSLPQNVSTYTRALDSHVHAHPQMDVAIVAGLGMVAGALFGQKLLRWGMLGLGAWAISRYYPQISSTLSSGIATMRERMGSSSV